MFSGVYLITNTSFWVAQSIQWWSVCLMQVVYPPLLMRITSKKLKKECLKISVSVNKEYYTAVLRCLRESIRHERLNLWAENSWIIYHVKALSHSSMIWPKFLTKRNETYSLCVTFLAQKESILRAITKIYVLIRKNCKSESNLIRWCILKLDIIVSPNCWSESYNLWGISVATSWPRRTPAKKISGLKLVEQAILNLSKTFEVSLNFS